MATEPAQHRLSAVLSADAVGYSRLMARDEDAAVAAVRGHREAIGRLVGEHGGRVVDAPGDNLLAEFGAATDAVRCALAIQRALAERNAGLADDARMEFRIGVHLGELRVEGERIYGTGVNVAARLEALAAPGGVCISQAVRDQTRGRLELDCEDLGEQTLKNIPDPVRAFRVRVERPSGPGAAAGRSEAERPAIAVLPFANMSGDPEQEYFADGMTEDLITDLSKVGALLVIARNSVFTYKGRAVKVQDVGRELGVSHVLEGSVRRAGGRVRINAQLVEAGTGHHVWADRYDRELSDVFAVQDEVTRQIVAALRLHLTDAERERVERQPTQNLEAYDCFLRGQVLVRSFENASIEEGRRLLERAIELDPDFAEAHAFLALALLLLGLGRARGAGPAIAAGERAVQVDDGCATAHSILGFIYGMALRYADGIAQAERALELNPSDSYAWLTLGTIHNHLGRHEQALPALERSCRLDPHGSEASLFHIGIAHHGLGHVAEAVEAYRGVLARNPHFAFAHAHLAVMYVEQGDMQQARAEIEALRRKDPEFSVARFEATVPVDDSERIEYWTGRLREAGLR